MIDFDPGYFAEPFLTLCQNYPDETAYPQKDFRVEWGPIFHRGRLDGTSRVLVIGQDPAQHETIVRRILVGEAGERLQGLLAKLGIDHSYTLINTYVYSVYGSASKYVDDAPVLAYRNKWIQAIFDTQKIEAVICLGDLAGKSWDLWLAAGGKAVPQVKIWHPTRPESSSRNKPAGELAKQITLMLENWNEGLAAIKPAVQNPDRSVPLVPYGMAFGPGEKLPIPARDVPAGLPAWMIAKDGWAQRGLPALPKQPLDGDAQALQTRRTIVVTVPSNVLGPQ
jgi:hypothetical protein